MQSLSEKNQPIDILTVRQVLVDSNSIEEIGGPYFLVELTNRVGSAANVEHHSRIVYQKAKSRDIISFCTDTIRGAYDGTSDIFSIYEELRSKISIQSLCPVFIGGTANDVMKLAQNVPDIKAMFGNFFKTDDLALFFAPKKTGKTILGYQIAEAIAKGESLFDGLVPNDAGPKRVLYADIELGLSDFKERYQNPHSKKDYVFSDNFFLKFLNPENFSFEDGRMLNEIEKLVMECQPEVLIIDNLTALMKSISDADSALFAIRTLLAMKYKYGLSILVMCHTPKKLGNAPLLSDDILGSGILLNLCTSVFGIRRSYKNKAIIYLKHCDTRNKKLIFDEDNIIQMRIDKVDNFLGFHFEGCGREDDHLIKKGDEAEKDVFEEAIQKYNNVLSWAKIKDELAYPYSAQALQKACIKYAERTLCYTYIQSEQKFVSWLECDKEVEAEKPECAKKDIEVITYEK
jgi:AAA domain/DnaB-like helicase N terminal domain